MITIKATQELSKQEIFNKVVIHLLTQKQQSLLESNDDVCAYRGRGNLKCAAGILIADDEYSREMEAKSWDNLIKTQIICPSKDPDIDIMIRELQKLHDTPYFSADRLKFQLRDFSIENNLQFPEI